jgi:hypothetical protein
MTTIDALDRLWARMAAIYGHRWTSSYGLAPDGAVADEWGHAIRGLTRDQAIRALERCRHGDDWPPTPGRFREWALGIPALDEVRGELLARDTRRSPFVLAVAQRLDIWRWRHADAREADRMLAAAHEAVRDAVLRGEPLPEPLPEITAEPEQRTYTPEMAARAMADIAAMLDCSKNEQSVREGA